MKRRKGLKPARMAALVTAGILMFTAAVPAGALASQTISESGNAFTTAEDGENTITGFKITGESLGNPSVIFGLTDKDPEETGQDIPGNSGDDNLPSDNTSGDGTDGPQYNTAVQLTEEDIQRMNGGNALFVYSNEGYLSTLIGKYYEEPIPVRPDDIMITVEAAINSLNGVASLIGLQKGSDFFINYACRDKNGYTYLTYQQRYGEQTVMNGTLHIVLDPKGYTAALSCSFTPSLGFAEETDILTKEEALELAKKAVPRVTSWYSDATDEAVIWFDEHLQNCYVLFADNPGTDTSFENMQYLKVYMTREGKICWILPSSTLTVSKDTSYYPTEEYFEDLVPVKWTGRLDLKGIGRKRVTIDVAYNPRDGLYYMIDPTRKMAVVDCYDFFYRNGTLTFLTSEDNEWEERDLAAMYNYQTAYDTYASIDIYSPDGFGTPILLGRKYVDRNGKPVSNACYMGQFQGWFTFVYSEVNDLCYDLDVVGHEYTHAVTNSSIVGDNYNNDAGAIDEAYSDIMGQLMEMMAERTTDETWMIGENSNEAARSMSRPELFYQPSAVGGAYYVPNAVTPVYTYNDNGGVHQNSGIINKAAYSIAEAGMSLEDMFSLFYTGLQILTPANSFADVHAALVFACRAGGMEEYEEVINQAFRSSNVLDAGYTRRELETEVIPQGCGRVSFAVPEHSDPRAVYVAVFYDGATGKHMVETWPDCDGEVCMALPEGDYYVDIVTVDLRNGKLYGCTFSDEGWVSLNEYNGDTFYVREGRITRLPDADKSGITAVTAAAETDRSGSSAMPAMPGGERAKTPAASPRSYTRRTFSENMGLDDDGNPIILEVLDAMVPEGWTEDFSVDWHSLSIEHPAEVRLLLTDPEGEVSFGYVSARSFHQEESYATQGKITGLIISHEDGEESESQRKTYLAYRTVGNYLMWLYGQQGMTVEIVEDRPADEELFGRFADYVTGNFGEMTALYDLFSQGTISSYEALAYDGSMVDIRLRLTDGDGTSYVDVIGAGDGYEHVAHLTGMDTYDVFWNIYGLYLMEADSEAKLDRYRDTYLDIIANLHEKSEFRRLSTALGLMLAQQSVVNNSLLLDDVYEYVVGHAPDNPTDPDAVIQSPEDIFSSGDEGMHWDEVTAGRTDYAAADGVVFTTGSDASAVYQRDDGFFVAGRRTEDAPEGEGWTKLEGK